MTCQPISQRQANPPRRTAQRGSRTVPITYCDRSLRARPGCRGTTRGTSTGCVPVQCVLPVRPRVASVQVERSARPGSSPLIRGFGNRAQTEQADYRIISPANGRLLCWLLLTSRPMGGGSARPPGPHHAPGGLRQPCDTPKHNTMAVFQALGLTSPACAQDTVRHAKAQLTCMIDH